MRRMLLFPLDLIRRIQHGVSTFFLKIQLESYGANVGAAKIPKIARTAKVTVGHNAGFNGMTISGLGGKNW